MSCFSHPEVTLCGWRGVTIQNNQPTLCLPAWCHKFTTVPKWFCAYALISLQWMDLGANWLPTGQLPKTSEDRGDPCFDRGIKQREGTNNAGQLSSRQQQRKRLPARRVVCVDELTLSLPWCHLKEVNINPFTAMMPLEVSKKTEEKRKRKKKTWCFTPRTVISGGYDQ